MFSNGQAGLVDAPKVVVLTNNPVLSQTGGCCSPPPGLDANGNAVHCLSLGALVTSFVTLVTFFLIPPFGVWSTASKIITLIACIAGITTSSIVQCTPSRSKFLYSSCALLYLLVAALILPAVLTWLSDEDTEDWDHFSGPFLLMLASPSILCSMFSLMCSVMAFKAARAMDTSEGDP